MIDDSAAPVTVTNTAVANRRAAAAEGSAARTIQNVASGSRFFVARRLSAGSLDSAAATSVQTANARSGAVSGAWRSVFERPLARRTPARTSSVVSDSVIEKA